MEERCTNCFVLFRIFTSCPTVSLSTVFENPGEVLLNYEFALMSASVYFLAFAIMIYSVKDNMQFMRQLTLLIVILVSNSQTIYS
jgi:hypothetical protein